MSERTGMPITLGFERICVNLPVNTLVPLKPLRQQLKKSKKYQQIVASIRAIGIVEPPVILPNKENTDQYYILDGNLRIEALKEIGETEVKCLLAKTDDTYTYNRRVNRLAAAQDRRMIVQAIERGASQKRIAETLGVDINTVRRRANLLNGICDEAREILADKPCPMKIFDILRDMNPLRQIEAAEFMQSSNNYSVIFARAILHASLPNQLVKVESDKQESESIREAMARQEKELASLQINIKTIEESYGENTLLLTISIGYLKRLMNNARVVMWLSKKHPEYLTEFQAIAETTGLPASGD